MLKKLWVKDYRNFDEFVIDLGKKSNFLIIGGNNQGKTNFLESIYFLGNGQSPRESYLGNLVNFDKQEAFLGLDFQKKDTTNRIYFKIGKDGKRVGLYNNKQIRSLSALGKQLDIEYISADIIRIFTESPDFRRKELDRFCSLYFDEYSKHLKAYEKVIKQKNRLIKSTQDKNGIRLWNKQLLEYAGYIVALRKQALVCLSEELVTLSRDVEDSFSRDLVIHYKNFALQEHDNESYLDILSKKLEDSIEKEIMVGYSLYGPHRDDFYITINEKSLFSFYSRGINRIFAILFKIAQFRKLSTEHRCFPVLLMDDAFAELDLNMKKKMVCLLDGMAQLFYTTVLEEDVSLFSDAQVFKMKKGVLTNG
jgi:DNA replication and repair protein RecF